MSIETQGFKELCIKLETIGTHAKSISNKAVNQGSKIVLEKMKSDAPRRRVGSKSSYKNLKKVKTKSYASGSVYQKIGIGTGNWEDTKGLFFHHYGAYSRSGSMWMTESFESVSSQAYEAIRQTVIQQINNDWK